MSTTIRNFIENVPKGKATTVTNRIPLGDRTNNVNDKVIVEGKTQSKPKEEQLLKNTTKINVPSKSSKLCDGDTPVFVEDLPTSGEAIKEYQKHGDKVLFEEVLQAYKLNQEVLKTQVDQKHDTEIRKLLDDTTSEISIMEQFLTGKVHSEPKTTKPTEPCEDIDAPDTSDPQSVTEYVNEIFDYLMRKERENRVPSSFMSLQTDVNEKMRGILVDWLVEVHRMFKLLPETLFLSIYIIDRFLELERITRDQLQLLGITSMLISSKYEEIYAPECNDFVYISDGAYTKKQILEMENLILNKLKFRLTTPLALQFLRRYSKAAGSDYNVHSLCKYILETMLLDVNVHIHPASLIAAGSVYIARKMTGQKNLWNATLEHYTSYPEEEVRTCALFMNTRLKSTRGSSLKAIEKKYSLPKFGQVTVIPLVDL